MTSVMTSHNNPGLDQPPLLKGGTLHTQLNRRFSIDSLCRCVGSRCDMAGSDEDRSRSSRPGAEDRGWSSIDQVIIFCVLGSKGNLVFYSFT
jgi:hypothetical protein